MLSAQSFWSPLPSSWQLRKTPYRRSCQLSGRRKLRRLRLRRLCRLRKGCRHGRCALRQVRPGGPKAAAAIAKIMGGEASAVEKKAVVQCQGSSEHCKPAYDYKGIQTCAAAATLYGGPKTCSLPASVWATAPRSVSSTPSTSWTVLPKVDKDKLYRLWCLRQHLPQEGHHDRRRRPAQACRYVLQPG